MTRHDVLTQVGERIASVAGSPPVTWRREMPVVSFPLWAIRDGVSTESQAYGVVRARMLCEVLVYADAPMGSVRGMLGAAAESLSAPGWPAGVRYAIAQEVELGRVPAGEMVSAGKMSLVVVYDPSSPLPESGDWLIDETGSRLVDESGEVLTW